MSPKPFESRVFASGRVVRNIGMFVDYLLITGPISVVRALLLQPPFLLCTKSH